MNKKILVVLTSIEKYPDMNRATGLWLGEAGQNPASGGAVAGLLIQALQKSA